MSGFPKSIDGDFLFPMGDIEEADSGEAPVSAVAKGCISEAIFKLECMKRGMMPFEPSHPDTKCDVIVQNKRGKLIGVQVKRACCPPSLGAGWQVNTATVSSRKKRTAVPYATGDFDFLAAHIPDGDVFCFWTLEFIARRTTVLWQSGISPSNNWEDLER
tara:strand:- start:212 stop:691 length:480 start_codon:yes stop_codon:yes gene_type:complete